MDLLCHEDLKRLEVTLNTFAYTYNGFRYYHNVNESCIPFLIDTLDGLMRDLGYFREVLRCDPMLCAMINILLNDALSMIGMLQEDQTFILASETLPIDNEDESYLSESEIDERLNSFYTERQLEDADVQSDY